MGWDLIILFENNWYSLKVNQTFYSIPHHISWIYFKNHHLSDLSLTLRAKLFYPNTCNNKICQHMKWELKATSFAKMVLYCIKIECLLPWPWAPADQIGFHGRSLKPIPSCARKYRAARSMLVYHPCCFTAWNTKTNLGHEKMERKVNWCCWWWNLCPSCRVKDQLFY